MKGFTQRQGWHFKGVFLLVVLLDHKKVGDELAVSPWCPWANSQSCSVPWWRIQTRWWADSDTTRDKTRRGAEEYDRVPALMDCFCVHWNKRQLFVQKSSNKGPLWRTQSRLWSGLPTTGAPLSFLFSEILIGFCNVNVEFHETVGIFGILCLFSFSHLYPAELKVN